MQHQKIEGSFDPNIMASIGRLLAHIEKGMTDDQIRHNSADVFFIDFVADVVRCDMETARAGVGGYWFDRIIAYPDRATMRAVAFFQPYK
jgi:hypothetical protein